MKIGLDVQLSTKVGEVLRKNGFTVVFAFHGATDESFFKSHPDCDLYVSPDYDWYHLACLNNKECWKMRERSKTAHEHCIASEIIRRAHKIKSN